MCCGLLISPDSTRTTQVPAKRRFILLHLTAVSPWLWPCSWQYLTPDSTRATQVPAKRGDLFLCFVLHNLLHFALFRGRIVLIDCSNRATLRATLPRNAAKGSKLYKTKHKKRSPRFASTSVALVEPELLGEMQRNVGKRSEMSKNKTLKSSPGFADTYGALVEPRL